MALLDHDHDAREVILRATVRQRLAEKPPPRSEDHIVATYYFAFRTNTLAKAVEEISYHATSGVKHPPKGSLLEACSASQAGIDPFDSGGKVGLLHVAFPLKMMLQPDGHLTTSDILHTVAGAVIFDMYENRDARLVDLQIPDKVVQTFPGPAYGPYGLRKLAGFAEDQPAFGTILKPTAGITPDDVERLVAEIAGSRLLMFVKEDEDLYPNLDYSPVGERTRRAVAAIERAREARGGLGLIYAPHISGAPHEILDTLHAVLEAGANGVMFSETYAGGTVRMVREATRYLEHPPAIYGHNAGVGTRSNGAIFREVIDLLARLDGIDLRQTAPVRPGSPYIRPYGLEWLASEEALTRPLPGIKPTMITRAGALDQGNLILNLMDVEDRGLVPNVLFLAGSAINTIQNAKGEPDPNLGTEAMLQALEIHRSGELRGIPIEGHLDALADLARRQGLGELLESLRQRYPGRVL
ncbi:RuBisCO large subunit C-terminal-like domain-containing protein [Tundrisphaera lichenicola]|uniref:RuBisCO large subunit C-terminal-like domain-containing protein n=1 Tax=Tundrisphaera lichenicola TaxID=2029860 RepID=UPI003EB96AB3